MSTPQETIAQSHNMLMFGREIVLPVDLTAGILPGESALDTTEYVIDLRRRLEMIFAGVQEKLGHEGICTIYTFMLGPPSESLDEIFILRASSLGRSGRLLTK